MTTKHLTEEEVQQYALDISACGIMMVKHVQLCEQCRVRVEAYQLMFTGIKQQESPAFDFDLSVLVMDQLPSAKAPIKSDNRAFYLLALSVVLVASPLIFFFRTFLLSLFNIDNPQVIYLIVTTIAGLLIFLTIDMYNNYQQKMKAIDFF